MCSIYIYENISYTKYYIINVKAQRIQGATEIIIFTKK